MVHILLFFGATCDHRDAHQYGWVSDRRIIVTTQLIPRNVNIIIPVEWTHAVLILALISIGMILTLFVYLNHLVKRPYFTLWIISWLSYAGYLAAAIALQESP